MKTIKIVLLIAVMTFITGCSHQFPLLGVIKTKQMPRDFEVFVAKDFVKKFSTYYPPARTTINFYARTSLEKRVEQKLREAGYATLSNKNNKLKIKMSILSTTLYSVIFTIKRGSHLSRAYYSSDKTKAFSSWTAINMPRARYRSVKFKKRGAL